MFNLSQYQFLSCPNLGKGRQKVRLRRSGPFTLTKEGQSRRIISSIQGFKHLKPGPPESLGFQIWAAPNSKAGYVPQKIHNALRNTFCDLVTAYPSRK
jgi:hypothetical protein